MRAFQHLQTPSAMLWSRLLLVITAAAIVQSGARERSAPAAQVHTEMRNVFYHYTRTIAVHIEWLDGAVLPIKEGAIPVFDDARSFLIDIHSGQIGISTRALSETLNHHVFAAKDAPLKDLQVTAQGQALDIKGKLRSKGDVPFETQSTVSVTSDGRIRVHAEKVKAAHLPVKGLMDLLGVDFSKLIDTRKVQGVRTEGDDLILDPQEILPLPRIRGKVTAIKIVGDQIVQIFGNGGPGFKSAKGNFMTYHGGDLRFGKLTMDNSDMDLIDLDPSDPFDFYLDHYRAQLSAGYTKITPQFGLRVYMRDYNKLQTSPKH